MSTQLHVKAKPTLAAIQKYGKKDVIQDICAIYWIKISHISFETILKILR